MNKSSIARRPQAWVAFLCWAVVASGTVVGMSMVELDPKLMPIADSLITRSNGIYGPDFVRDLVAHIAAEFDDVPVRDYVEVLIAKEAMDELRRLNALRTLTS